MKLSKKIYVDNRFKFTSNTNGSFLNLNLEQGLKIKAPEQVNNNGLRMYTSYTDFCGIHPQNMTIYDIIRSIFWRSDIGTETKVYEDEYHHCVLRGGRGVNRRGENEGGLQEEGVYRSSEGMEWHLLRLILAIWLHLKNVTLYIYTYSGSRWGGGRAGGVKWDSWADGKWKTENWRTSLFSFIFDTMHGI